MSTIREKDRKADLLQVPTSGGIDFDSLKRRIHSGELDGTFQGISGKQLSFNVVDLPNLKALSILDEVDIDSDCKLIATLQPLDTLNLALSRKYKPPNSGRHPDLKAAPFVDFSLSFFAGLGLKIAKFQGVWNEGSDNHESFIREYVLLGDRVAAAKSTWSGKIMGAHGFTQITEDDIEIDSERELVRALFHRTQRGH